MNLYNLRSTERGFRINKFDMDANFLASYNTSETECDCPAGHRPSCKHRKMIHRMRAHVDDGWFLCWETQKWHRPMDEDAGVRGEAEGNTDTKAEECSFPDCLCIKYCAVRIGVRVPDRPKDEAEGMDEGSMPLPEGVTVIGLEDPELVHNTIAEAVGEAPRPLVTRR